MDEADYEAPSGVDSPKPCIYNTILPEPDYELDNEEMSNNYDVPASPGPINRTDSDYECIWSDADDSRPPTPNYEGVYEIPGPRSLPRGVVPGEEYDDIIGPEGRYCAPPTTEQEIYGELKQRNCFTIDRENIRSGCRVLNREVYYLRWGSILLSVSHIQLTSAPFTTSYSGLCYSLRYSFVVVWFGPCP